MIIKTISSFLHVCSHRCHRDVSLSVWGKLQGLWVATGFGNVLKKAKGVWSWEISGVSYGFGVELLLNHDFHQVHLHCSASSPFVN